MLKPKRPRRKPDRAIDWAYDIEFDDQRGLLAIGLTDGERFFLPETFTKLLDIVTDGIPEDVTVRLWAHYGRRVDHLALIASVPGFLEQILGKPGDFVGYVGSWRGIRIELRDTFNFFPLSLDRLAADILNERKLPLPELPGKVYDTDRDLFFRYLENDCRLVYRIVEHLRAFCAEWGVPVPWTAASLALRVWLRFLYDHGEREPVYTVTVRNPRARALIEESYKGGYVAAFVSGAYDDCIAYDVNSMYPWCMRDVLVPTIPYCRYVRRYEPGKLGVYRVRFHQHRRDVPPVFLVRKKDGLEPSFEGETVVTSIELDYASRFLTYDVIEGLTFSAARPLFRDYIETMYQRRRDAIERGDKSRALFYKLLLNSLYGKFAERGESWELAARPKPGDVATFYPELGMFLVRRERLVRHRSVPISAFITALARVRLHAYIVRFLEQGIPVLYCDTDSLKTLGEAPEGIPVSSSELGALKIEKIGRIAIAGRKLYVHCDETKAKGFGRHPALRSAIERAALDATAKTDIEWSAIASQREVLFSHFSLYTGTRRRRTLQQTYKDIGIIWSNSVKARLSSKHLPTRSSSSASSSPPSSTGSTRSSPSSVSFPESPTDPSQEESP